MSFARWLPAASPSRQPRYHSHACTNRLRLPPLLPAKCGQNPVCSGGVCAQAYQKKYLGPFEPTRVERISFLGRSRSLRLVVQPKTRRLRKAAAHCIGPWLHRGFERHARKAAASAAFGTGLLSPWRKGRAVNRRFEGPHNLRPWRQPSVMEWVCQQLRLPHELHGTRLWCADECPNSPWPAQ